MRQDYIQLDNLSLLHARISYRVWGRSQDPKRGVNFYSAIVKETQEKIASIFAANTEITTHVTKLVLVIAWH